MEVVVRGTWQLRLGEPGPSPAWMRALQHIGRCQRDGVAPASKPVRPATPAELRRIQKMLAQTYLDPNTTIVWHHSIGKTK